MSQATITSAVHSDGAWETVREGVCRGLRLRRWFWSASVHWARTRPYLSLLKHVASLEGDILECGVFRGRSLMRMAMTARRIAPEKTVYGLDSFDGFPTEAVTDGDLGPGRSLEKVRGRFKGASRVPLRLLKAAEDLKLNIRLLPGFFEDTLPALRSRRFCFVHLDCDIYESYKTCLDAVYDLVVPGGIILFDEYACPVWPGATRAVNEFFANRPEKPLAQQDRQRPEKPKYFIRKQPVPTGKRAAA